MLYHRLLVAEPLASPKVADEKAPVPSEEDIGRLQVVMDNPVLLEERLL